MEGHLDIGSGNRNKTKIFVEEMVNRIESMGLEPKIKPDSLLLPVMRIDLQNNAICFPLYLSSIFFEI